MVIAKQSIRYKVRIPLGASNFLGPALRQSQSIPDLCGGGALHRSEVYLTMVGTRSGPTLEGFLIIKNKIRMVIA